MDEQEQKSTFKIDDAKDAFNKQQEKVEETQKTADEKKSTDDNNLDDVGTEKKKKPRAQKRIESLSSEKRELQKRIAELEAEKDGKKSESNHTKDLDPDDYADYDAYLDALDEQDAETPKKEVKPAQKVDSDFQKVLDDIEIKFDDTRDKYEDFDNLVTKSLADGGPAISQTMLETMNEFDNAGEIAYALATDVTNSIRIANLKPMKQILEINKLSAKLDKEKGEKNKPPTKKSTNAPEPINVLGGGETPSNTLAEARNYSDYQKLRSKENRARNGW
jgi:chromosome segregation ATPase